MIPIVHLHLHRRRTGITRHVEDVARGLPAEVAGFGIRVSPDAMTVRTLLDRARAGALVLHAHRNLELLLALALRWRNREIRVVWTRHGSGRPSAWTRFLARRADARIALTAVGARELALPCDVVGHGVDTDVFAPPASRAEAWNALGIGGERGLGAVGRIRPEKGQADLAAAWPVLSATAPGWRAVVVGRIAPRDRAWASRILGASGVEQLEEVDDAAAVHRGLTVLVQPSRRESFSLVLLEAMASGACVVAAHLPHYPDLVEHGRTGFLYPAGDVGALVALLRPLLAEPARAEAVGRAAREEVLARWTLARELDGLRAVYARMERLA